MKIRSPLAFFHIQHTSPSALLDIEKPSGLNMLVAWSRHVWNNKNICKLNTNFETFEFSSFCPNRIPTLSKYWTTRKTCFLELTQLFNRFSKRNFFKKFIINIQLIFRSFTWIFLNVTLNGSIVASRSSLVWTVLKINVEWTFREW